MIRPHRLIVLLVPALLLGAVGLAAARDAQAEGPWRRRSRSRPERWHGPIPVRDGWMLAQPRLTLPAMSPDPAGAGRLVARLETGRGSDFGWNQDVTGESPQLRRFMVDGDHQTTALELSYGASSALTLGLRMSHHTRGAGWLDGVVDAFHEATTFRDNLRKDFHNDLYRIEGFDSEGAQFSWERHGSGWGSLELSASWVLPVRSRCATTALVARADLPTGSGPFSRRGIDAGLQLVHAQTLSRRFRAYAGFGVTWYGNRQLDGVRFERWRGQAFAALEFRLTQSLNLVIDATYGTRLVDGIFGYPSTQLMVNTGFVQQLGPRTSLEFLVIENVADQQSTTDFGVSAAIVHRF